MFDQLFSRCLHAMLENDDGMHSLAPLVAWDPDHRDLGHGRMRGDGVLHLDGVHVLSAGDDHVLHPVGQVQEAVFVDEAHVAGAIPAVAHDRFSLRRLLPVFAHEVSASGAHLPRLSSRECVAERIGDAKLDTEQRPARGRQRITAPAVILGAEKGERRSRLGHAISLDEVGIGKHLQPSFDEVLRDR